MAKTTFAHGGRGSLRCPGFLTVPARRFRNRTAVEIPFRKAGIIVSSTPWSSLKYARQGRLRRALSRSTGIRVLIAIDQNDDDRNGSCFGEDSQSWCARLPYGLTCWPTTSFDRSWSSCCTMTFGIHLHDRSDLKSSAIDASTRINLPAEFSRQMQIVGRK